MRLYEPTKGKILLDGVDIRELDPVWLRSHIGYVSQVCYNFLFIKGVICIYIRYLVPIVPALLSLGVDGVDTCPKYNKNL